MKNYNGWTTYATWKINLEIFDGGYEFFKDYDAECLRDYVVESLELNCDNDLTLSYAMDFIDDVNFYEIADHIKEYNSQD